MPRITRQFCKQLIELIDNIESSLVSPQKNGQDSKTNQRTRRSETKFETKEKDWKPHWVICPLHLKNCLNSESKNKGARNDQERTVQFARK